MTDISKCDGEDCPLKDKCYRYTAPSDDLYQSWVEPAYKDGDCDNLYWTHNAQVKKKEGK